MNENVAISEAAKGTQMPRIFISYASADREHALAGLKEVSSFMSMLNRSK